jgi:hypothetical protein
LLACWPRAGGWAADRPQPSPEITLQTKPEIASTLLFRSSVHFGWVIADEGYGRHGAFLGSLEAANQQYVVELPGNTTVWPDRPLRQTPDELVWQVRSLAGTISQRGWRIIQLREGAKGLVAFELARLRVWSVRHRRAGAPSWLLIRRSLDPIPEVKYYLSNAGTDVALESLTHVSGTRGGWRRCLRMPRGKRTSRGDTPGARRILAPLANK